MRGIGAWLLIPPLLATACAPLSPPGPTTTPRPGTAPPSEMLEPLGEVLVLRAYSGEFFSHQERTERGFPDIVVFDDGEVVAVSTSEIGIGRPQYASLSLSPDELAQLVDQLAAADWGGLAAGAFRERTRCEDCGTTIIRTDVDGETVEVSAHGLYTDTPPAYVASLPYPESLIELDRTLNELRRRVAAEGQTFEGEVPRIPVSPHIGG